MYQKVILIGNLGQDAKYEGGNRPVNFSMATNERYTDANGEKQSRTEWHNVALWGKEEYKDVMVGMLTSGKLVMVEGKIRTNVYTDKEGVEQQRKYIQADGVTLLGGGGAGGAKEKESAPKAAARTAAKSRASTKPVVETPEDDDDLPF